MYSFSFPEDSLLGDGDVSDGDTDVSLVRRLVDGSPTPRPSLLLLGFVLLKEREMRE